jgi:hypothetical protein
MKKTISVISSNPDLFSITADCTIESGLIQQAIESEILK